MFRSLWDFVSMILIVYWSLYLPYTLALSIENKGFLYYLDTISQVWFIIDIMLNFNTGYSEKGVLIMNRRKIALFYLKSWFAIDLLASFPYDWFLIPLEDDSTM